MNKILLVAWREISQQVRSRGYIFSTIGTPILLMGIWALTGSLDANYGRPSMLEEINKASQQNPTVGYVDHSGIIQSLPPGIPEGTFIAFPDEGVAGAALRSKQLEAYYVLAPDYPSSGEIKRVSSRMPMVRSNDATYLSWVLAWNLAPGQSVEDVARLRSPLDPQGLQFITVSSDGLPNESAKSVGMGPFLVAILVMMPLFTAGGYLLQGLAREKENRVIEVLLVSLRPQQLLAGKLLGLSVLTLLQFAALIVLGGLTIKVTGRDPLALLRSVNLSGSEPGLVAVYAAGGFLLYATLMAGLGALTPNLDATRMWSLVVTGPMILPMLLMVPLMDSPNGPLAVAMSLVPLCSPVGMLMRLMVTSVPAWEVALSLALLVAASLAALWAMSRLFRATTLLSGQTLSLGRFWDAVRVR